MVHRPVVIGVGIQIAAQAACFARDLPDRPPGCAFEEHMFDDMGNSGNAILLIEISGLHKSGYAGKGNGLLLAHDHGQTVLEDHLGRLPLIFTESVRSHDLIGLRFR